MKLILAFSLLAAFPAAATASTLASWNFENGDLSASVQGNFVATSIEVFNGGAFSHAPSSGVGGGGALAYEQNPTPGPGPSNIVFFTIANTHPTDPIQLDLVSMSFGGEAGESYVTWFRVNMESGLGDIDDSVASEGAWTSRTYDLSGLGISNLPAGDSVSIGWSLLQDGPSNLTTHFLDNISFTGTEPVPEPSVALLFAVGVGSVFFNRRRNR